MEKWTIKTSYCRALQINTKYLNEMQFLQKRFHLRTFYSCLFDSNRPKMSVSHLCSIPFTVPNISIKGVKFIVETFVYRRRNVTGEWFVLKRSGVHRHLLVSSVVFIANGSLRNADDDESPATTARRRFVAIPWQQLLLLLSLFATTAFGHTLTSPGVPKTERTESQPTWLNRFNNVLPDYLRSAVWFCMSSRTKHFAAKCVPKTPAIVLSPQRPKICAKWPTLLKFEVVDVVVDIVLTQQPSPREVLRDYVSGNSFPHSSFIRLSPAI